MTITFCHPNAHGASSPVEPPTTTTIPPGTHPVSAVAKLGSCPEQVCINFSQTMGSIADIAGQYTHTCSTEANPRIPTVSEWGLIVMTLLCLTIGTIMFGRQRRPAAA